MIIWKDRFGPFWVVPWWTKIMEVWLYGPDAVERWVKWSSWNESVICISKIAKDTCGSKKSPDRCTFRFWQHIALVSLSKKIHEGIQKSPQGFRGSKKNINQCFFLGDRELLYPLPPQKICEKHASVGTWWPSVGLEPYGKEGRGSVRKWWVVQNIEIHPKDQHRTWKWSFGRCFSFFRGVFSGSMLMFLGVSGTPKSSSFRKMYGCLAIFRTRFFH